MSNLPLESGRQWAQIQQVAPDATNRGYWVQDPADPRVRAYFKYLNPMKPLVSGMYSLGVERVAYSLAEDIAIPVPETYLEELQGEHGVVVLRAPGSLWYTVEGDLVDRSLTFADRDMWTLYMAFDVLLGNFDRHSRNIFVEWDPPTRRKPVEGEQCVLHLIDFGWAGLWPPYKFGANLRAADLEQLDPRADVLDEYVTAMRNNMPPGYRTQFAFRGTEERTEVVEILSGISDDAIESAVQEVPDVYMTPAARDLTVELLCGRRDRLDSLLDVVFPQ